MKLNLDRVKWALVAQAFEPEMIADVLTKLSLCDAREVADMFGGDRRERIAAVALNALIMIEGTGWPEGTCVSAVRFTDLLIAELDKNPREDDQQNG